MESPSTSLLSSFRTYVHCMSSQCVANAPCYFTGCDHILIISFTLVLIFWVLCESAA